MRKENLDTEVEFLTIKDAAQMLNVHENTIRTAISSGSIKAYRLGSRTIRIKREQLLESLTPYRAGELGQWKTR